MKKRYVPAIFWGLPVILGVVFYIWYVFKASDNVAYSDYIRLINSYLPDVTNPAKFFVPDILTRVPITYLGRIINVKLFAYNTYFDMLLGVLSLGAGALVLALYACNNRTVGYISFLLIQFIYFSLNKWEMVTNGTGWVCILSISGFIFHFAVLDHAAATQCKEKRDRIMLVVLPIVLVLLVAGPYSGGYAVILILAYAALFFVDYKKRNRLCVRTWCIGALTTLFSMILYLWSNSKAVYVHRGAVTDVSIVQEFSAQPLFFLKFLLKAVASSVIGVAQIEELEANCSWFVGLHVVYLIGIAVFASYLLALYLNVRFHIYEKTIFPLLLVLSGGCNHLLVLAGRWIFLKDEYGMSSRYEIQYQMGIVGILFTFAIVYGIYRDKKSETAKYELAKEKLTKDELAKEELAKKETDSIFLKNRTFYIDLNMCMFCFTILVFCGNAWTTKKEIKTAPFRREYLQISKEIGLNYRTASDEELEMYLHNDPDEVRKAMRILEENKLNIFCK